MTVAPVLDRQISGVVLHNLTWRGRTFTLSVGARHTTVTLAGGDPLPASTPQGPRTVSVGHSLSIPTARPDLTPTAAPWWRGAGSGRRSPSPTSIRSPGR